MEPDFSRLDASLAARGVDGYLIDADSENADQYYLSGFDAPDPFVTLYDGEVRLLFARSLEYGRAKKEARAATVERNVDFGYREKISEHGAGEAQFHVLAEFLRSYDVESVAAPPRFPVSIADGLRDQDVTVEPDQHSVVEEVRATKTDEEVELIRSAQAANETAMAAAESLLGAADVDSDGHLSHGGDVLTSERVKEEIEVTLLENGCALDQTIVAGGSDAADPHERGSGPLPADAPIIVDIFPRDKASKYNGDMTRTFLVGEAGEDVREWYGLTERASEAALDAVEPGATGADVHDAACDVYEDAGQPTLRSDESAETGFIHSTGHGVGLDVHEQPSVGPNGGELEPGHVITVEPGLYYPEVGGVRLEDLVVVTEDSYENLTDYPMELVV